MPYDEREAARVRQALSGRSDVVEKRIVGGGLGFMVAGRLCCAVTTRGLTVRVGAEGKEEVLGMPYVRPHLVGGRETKAFVVVEPAGLSDDETLETWVARGVRFVETAP